MKPFHQFLIDVFRNPIARQNYLTEIGTYMGAQMSSDIIPMSGLLVQAQHCIVPEKNQPEFIQSIAEYWLELPTGDKDKARGSLRNACAEVILGYTNVGLAAIEEMRDREADSSRRAKLSELCTSTEMALAALTAPAAQASTREAVHATAG